MFGRPNTHKNDESQSIDNIHKHIASNMDFSFFSDTEIQVIFEQVLDNLLLPPMVKDKMMTSSTRDKKIQTILMHKEALNENKSNDAYEQLKSILKLVKTAKVADISSVIKIRVFLSTANKGGVDTFLMANGIEILQKHIDNRLDKTLLNELDAALLFELLSCYKSILNQESVTEQIVCIPGVVEQMVRSLRFEWKPVVLLSLEMLSVCCFFSSECAHIVAKSFRRLAKTRNEFPFALLLVGLQETDIEVRAGVARLVNDLIMGLASIQDRSILFTELSSILYSDKFETLVTAVKIEIAGLTSPAAIAEAAARATDSNYIYSESSVSIAGSGPSISAIAADSQKRQFSIFNFTKSSVSTTASKPIFPVNTILPQGTMSDCSFSIEECITVRRGKESVLCCPTAGTMAGTLVASKDMNETFTTALGIKKTKHRWYICDGERIKWFRDEDERGEFLISSVVDIREYTSDPNLMKDSNFCFEIETTDRHTPVLRVGADTAAEKESWLKAVTIARDAYTLKKSTYKLQMRDLSKDDIIRCAYELVKHHTVYFSLMSEDREELVTAMGLDLTNVKMVGDYLYHEMMAMGLSEEYLTLLHELLLVPAGSESIWAALIANVKKLRKLTPAGIKDESKRMSTSTSIDLDSAVWSDQTVSSLLKAKSNTSRGEYTQMSRLALSAMSKDYEIQELKSKLERYEGYFKGTHHLSGRDLDTLRLDEQQRHAIENAAASFVSVYGSSGHSTATGSSVTTSAVSEIKANHVQNDPRFKIYFQMKQNSTSNDVIKRKMALDGMSALDIEAFVKFNDRVQVTTNTSISTGQGTGGGFVLPQSGVTGATAITSAPTAEQSFEDIIASLAGEFDKFDKYKTLFKVLPANIIKQKMMADGISEVEADACLARNGLSVPKDDGKTATTAAIPKTDPSKDPPPSGMDMKKPVGWKSKKKLKPLFWIKVKNSDIPGTVWTKVNQNYTLTNGCFGALEDYFNTERLEAATAKKAAMAAAASNNGVLLFDSKRTQNVMIFLTRIQLSPSKLAQYVIRLDPSELDASLTERLIPYCPTNDEINTVRAYENPTELDPVGQLFFALASIPRIEKRLKIHDTCFKWDADATTVASQLNVYSMACDQLKVHEATFNKLLGMILAIGNVLNDGTPRGVAFGVKLDVITRLIGIKTCKQAEESLLGTSEFLGSSLLHLVAWEAYNSAPEIISLVDKFQSVIAASNLSYRQVEQDTKQLHDSIQSVRSEIDVSMIRIREEGGDEIAEPLKKRIQAFAVVAEPRMLEIVILKNEVALKLKETLTQFNEPYSALDETVKNFFGNMHSFLRSLRQAIVDNEKFRVSEESLVLGTAARKPAPTPVDPQEKLLAATAALAMSASPVATKSTSPTTDSNITATTPVHATTSAPASPINSANCDRLGSGIMSGRFTPVTPPKEVPTPVDVLLQSPLASITATTSTSQPAQATSTPANKVTTQGTSAIDSEFIQSFPTTKTVIIKRTTGNLASTLFDNYHSTQDASAEVVIEQFKSRKQRNPFFKASSGSEPAAENPMRSFDA